MIVDIVASRRLNDRPAAQRAIRDAFADAAAIASPTRALWATAGDEFQIEYATPSQAFAATGFVRIALAASDLDVRFGIGAGDSRVIEHGERGDVLDGSAWWRAREAIEEAERRAGRSGSARTWALGEGITDADRAALLLRDQVIAQLAPREHRIAAALLTGRTQKQIAVAEQISQSAVSQAAARSGVNTLVHVQSLWLHPNDD